MSNKSIQTLYDFQESNKKLSPEVKTVMVPLLIFLVEFLHKWFLTPEGQRKPFFRALLVATYREFWDDLFGLRDRLDKVIEKL